MNKIRILSAILRFLFTVLLFLLPAYTLLYWLSNGYPFGHWMPLSVFPWSETAPRLPSVDTLTPTVKIVAFVINMVPISIYMLILYFLTRLFRLYQSNQIFSIACVRNIRLIGWMMLVNQLIHPIYTFMISAAMTYNLPPGFRFGYIGIFNLPKLMAIVVALMIILISWIMEEALRIYEENSYTV